MSKIVRSTRGGPFSFRRRNFVPPGVKKGVQPNPPAESKPPAPDNGAVGPNLPTPGNGGAGVPDIPTTPITPPPGSPDGPIMRIMPIDFPPPGATPAPAPTPAPTPTPQPKSALDQYREKMQSRLKDYQPGRPVQQQPAQTPSSGLIGGAMTDYSKPYSM